MGKKTSQGWKQVVRITVQILFLALFTALLFIGKLQLWFAVFALGVMLSPFLGRIYCGWACPMNTLFRPIAWFYKKTGIKRLKTPAFLKKPIVRVIPLVSFALIMVFMRRSGTSLPILAILTAVSLLVTLFIEEAFWHNSICPFGTIFSISARPAKKTYRVLDDKCIACGKCQKVCPVHAIDTKEDGKRYIRGHDCISCGSCAAACPTKAIRW